MLLLGGYLPNYDKEALLLRDKASLAIDGLCCVRFGCFIGFPRWCCCLGGGVDEFVAGMSLPESLGGRLYAAKPPLERFGGEELTQEFPHHAMPWVQVGGESPAPWELLLLLQGGVKPSQPFWAYRCCVTRAYYLSTVLHF